MLFRTLRVKTPLAAAFLLTSFALSLPAAAVQIVPSQTFKSGTKIACVLDERLDSSQLSYGDKFKLRVVDTSHGALNGSEIIGYITDVQKPHGVNEGRVGFFLTNIKLPNGEKKTITAYVVNRRVTRYNPGASYAARQQLAPGAGRPYGSVTPGPIAWQMNMGSGPSSARETHSPSLGGYVYASASQWPIIVPSGTPVTVELAEALTVP